MNEDYLAQWISEHPTLITKLEQHPQLENYFRRTQPTHTQKRVDDQTWNQITQQLAQ